MAQDSPLVACAFGWGQTFRLYRNRLEVDGASYDLKDLIHINLAHHRILGISSARLELRFARKRLILRGIAAVNEARKAADYLKTWYEDSRQVTDYSIAPSYGDGALRQSSRGESRVNARRPAGESFPALRVGSAYALQDDFATPDWEHERIAAPLQSAAERLEMIKTNISLPIVRVPVRLLPGEHAHYSTSATLCGERAGSEQEIRKHHGDYYPERDHGMLILTNRRMIYIGRNGQIVLEYNSLLHFSRLRTAVAFQADHWQKRVIFAVPRPIECALYMEAILHRLQQTVSYHEQLL
ncbi:MAG TPA: hypothetical protein VKV20_07450 [Ktedonobacteraceae bacterium]|nr:hypothetical protein [Ktedonobacteraceae bacterium]